MPPQASDVLLNICLLALSIKKTGDEKQPKPRESPCQTPQRVRRLQIQRQDIQAGNHCHITQQDAKTTRVKTERPRRQLEAFRKEAVLCCADSHSQIRK